MHRHVAVSTTLALYPAQQTLLDRFLESL